MKNKRDDFSPLTKKTLAERVAWKCSFPGCNRITIGPQKGNTNKSLNLGEAAHITAASENGPRYNSNLGTEKRKSIENGIWMCRHHATLIDNDFKEYSIESIREWKEIAEETAYQELIEFSEERRKSLTLIQITGNCIFFGEWLSIKDFFWSFSVDKFLIGDRTTLNEICLKINENRINNFDNFVVIESQGDGREIDQMAKIETSEKGIITITIKIKSRSERIMPKDIGDDLNLDDNDNIIVLNGDLSSISGKDAGLQSIFSGLSTAKGEILMNPEAGSVFSKYYWQYKNDIHLLNSLLKLELARLVTVPIYRDSNNLLIAALNFINRIINANIINPVIENNRIPVSIEIEFNDNSISIKESKIYIHDE